MAHNQLGRYLQEQRGSRTLRDIVDIAQRKGHSLSYEGYRKIEQAMVTPSDTTLEKIAKAMGLDLRYLKELNRESILADKLGEHAAQTLNISHEAIELDGYLKRMTEDQKALLFQMVQQFTMQNSVAARAKYCDCVRQGTNIAVIAPDLLDTFPDSDAVNEALRGLKQIAEGARKRVVV